MCGSEEEIRKSHIIPRSYFKYIKSSDGQLVRVTIDDATSVSNTNGNPTEFLLCSKCEQFISAEYEKYGTRLFKDSKNVQKAKTYITFNGFKYKQFYLYLISILWRASISSLPEFKSVNLHEELNDILRQHLINKTIKINTSYRLDHFIKISVLRMIDSTNSINDDIIKSILMTINIDRSPDNKSDFAYYFMVDGFLIIYYINLSNDPHTIRTKKIYGQLKDRTQISIPKEEIHNLKQISDAFSALIEKSKSQFI